jgi:hypothetical protein
MMKKKVASNSAVHPIAKLRAHGGNQGIASSIKLLTAVSTSM